MQNLLLVLMVLYAFSVKADFRTEPREVLADLEASKTVYAEQYRVTKNYANKMNLKGFRSTLSNLSQDHNGYKTLNIVFQPGNTDDLETYDRLLVTIYFVEPTHFEISKNRGALHFYKFESVVDHVRTKRE